MNELVKSPKTRRKEIDDEINQMYEKAKFEDQMKNNQENGQQVGDDDKKDAAKGLIS